MKSTGIVRRIDDLGRVAIPKEIRRTLHIKEGDPLELFTDGGCVCFKKYNTTELFKEALDDLLDLMNDSDMASCTTPEEKVMMKSMVDLLKKRWEERQENDSPQN